MNEIDDIAARYVAAVLAKDEAAFLALYDEAVVVFDMWEDWTYQGRDALAGMVRDWFGSLGEDRVGVRFEPVMSRVDGDWAVWGAIVRYAGLNAAGEELRSMENRMSWTLRRGPAGWRIVHQHSSSPADFSTMAVKLKRG